MKNYFFYLITTVVGLFCIIAALNFVIDPNLVYKRHDEAWHGISRTFKLQARPHKAAQITKLAPDLLVLGTSRAFDGLPMQHELLAQFTVPYNAALYDATLAEMELLLRHAHCAGGLRKVIISLDFFTFNDNRLEFHHQDLRQHVKNESCKTKQLFFIEQLFSLSELNLLTILKNQSKPYKYDINSKGEVDDRILLTDRRNTLDLIEKSEDNYKNLNTFYKDYKLSSKSLKSLESMLVFLIKNNIDTTLFISPIHANRLELLDQVVGIAVFEQWKREVVKMNYTVAKERGVVPFKIWDFTDYNPYVTELLPTDYSSEPMMEFHWDTSHYQKSLGALVWSVIFNDPNRPENFGTLLSNDIIDVQLQELRTKRALWNRAYQHEN